MIQGLYPIFNHWSAAGTVWLYSDPHFDDQDLEVGIANRPSSEEQVALINSKVGRKDTLICLGDVGNPDWVRQLKGYKVLICGNHDAGISNYQRKKVGRKFDADKYTKEEAIEAIRKECPKWKLSASLEYELTHAPFEYWYVTADNGLFDEVYEGPLMIGEKLLLSHEPIDVPWAFNIHGHVHDPRAKDKKNQLNVCADHIAYTPVNFNQLMKKGLTHKVETIHRATIDKAAERKRNKKRP